MESTEMTAPNELPIAIGEIFEGPSCIAVDGLPAILPTEERVRKMLSANRAKADILIAIVPPRGGMATMETVAANCVMAGCRDDYFPVVVSALRAMATPSFGLAQVQATTHVCAPLAIVNGPIRHKVGLNGGTGLFGPGNRANATIGRAIRLVLMNIGGGLPVSGDRSTFGHPGKYTYCVAELEEASPWGPLSTYRGFSPQDNVVTVIACEAPRSVSDHPSKTGEGILETIADSIAVKGHNNAYLMGEMVVLIGVEHAHTLAKEGWSRQDVQRFLFEHARMPMRELVHGGLMGIEEWPDWVDRENPETLVPMVAKPEGYILFVGGGEAGRFSLIMPGWGSNSVSVGAPIEVYHRKVCRLEGGGQC